MSKSLARVMAALEAAGETARPVEMAAETRTAQQAAAAEGCGLDQIVKSILFAGVESGRLYLFLTAGGNRVDPAKASAVAGQRLGKADAALIRAETGFAIGGVAPVGHLGPVEAFWDPRLSEFDTVWAAAGTPFSVFPLAPADLQRLTGAPWADVHQEAPAA